MALPLPQGKQIQVTHRILPADYAMPAMEAAADHYALGLILHGDRSIITPTMTYTLHPGYVNALAPFLYHKTLPASADYYESILIKFSPEFVKPFSDRLGSQVLDQIFQYPPKSFGRPARDKIMQLANDMLLLSQNTSHGTSYMEFRLQILLFEMLLLIYEEGILDEAADVHSTTLTQPILEAVYFMELHYMNPLKMEEAANISGYSPSYFSRLFQTQLGTSFSEYLSNIRLKHVQDQLLGTSKSVTEIALENGYAYPGNMTDAFKRKFGMTPLHFRKLNR